MVHGVAWGGGEREREGGRLVVIVADNITAHSCSITYIDINKR